MSSKVNSCNAKKPKRKLPRCKPVRFFYWKTFVFMLRKKEKALSLKRRKRLPKPWPDSAKFM